MKRIVPIAAPTPEITSVGTIAQAIKSARTQSGLRQIDTAAMCGVSLQTLVDIEAGSPGVSIGRILKVADGLGVRLFAFDGTSVYAIRDFLAQQKQSTQGGI